MELKFCINKASERISVATQEDLKTDTHFYIIEADRWSKAIEP